MTDKRFNYTCEKIGQHWGIEISDNQTKEPFDVNYIKITDNYSQTKDNVKFIVKLLNELHEENEDLKSFNEDLAENLSGCANARISKDNLIETLRKENKKLKKLLLIKRVKGILR